MGFTKEDTQGLICVWCQGGVDWDGRKHSFVHRSTGSLYLCAHMKDPKNCCGIDDHCALPTRAKE